jgi:hypothetical protein
MNARIAEDMITYPGTKAARPTTGFTVDWQRHLSEGLAS